ncbi:hypothetical protein [Nocardia carnea]|uniref:hypothetical protein n=1 Tax=Nocardia carnea TaxID=37328 RepID=UPI002456940F|nr:hypothetical protein [Nocardia carnea]
MDSGQETSGGSSVDSGTGGDKGGSGVPPSDTGAGAAGHVPMNVVAALSNTLAARHPGGLIQPPGRVDAVGMDMRALEQIFDGNFVRTGFERGATPRQERFRLRLLARAEQRRLAGIGRSKAEKAREQAQQRDEEMQAEVDELSRVRAGLAAGQDPGANIEARLADTARSRHIDTQGLPDAARWTVYAGMVGEQIAEKRSARERARAEELAAGAREAAEYAARGAEERARLRRLGDERKSIAKKKWRRRSTPEHLRESLEELGPGGTLVVVEEYANADAYGVNARTRVLYLDGDTVMVDDGVSGGPKEFDFSEPAGVERTFTAGIRGDGSPMVRGPGVRGDGPPQGNPGGGGDGTAGYVPESVDPGDEGPDFRVPAPGGQPENSGIPPVDPAGAAKRVVGSDSGVVSAGPIPEPETSVPLPDLDEVGIAAVVPELAQQRIRWRIDKVDLGTRLYLQLNTDRDDDFIPEEIRRHLGGTIIAALNDPDPQIRRYVDDEYDRLRAEINRIAAGLPAEVFGATTVAVPESSVESTRIVQALGDLWSMPDRPKVLTPLLRRFAELHDIVVHLREVKQYTTWIDAIDALDSAMHREFVHPGTGDMSTEELHARAREFAARAAEVATVAAQVQDAGRVLDEVAKAAGLPLRILDSRSRPPLLGPATAVRFRQEAEELGRQADTLAYGHPDRSEVMARLGSLNGLLRNAANLHEKTIALEAGRFELDVLAGIQSSVESGLPQDGALEQVAEHLVRESDPPSIDYCEPTENIPSDQRRRNWLAGIEALDRAVRHAWTELEFAKRAGGDDPAGTRAIERMYWQWRVDRLSEQTSLLTDMISYRARSTAEVPRLLDRLEQLVRATGFDQDTGVAADYREELSGAVALPLSPQRLRAVVADIRAQRVAEQLGRLDDDYVVAGVEAAARGDRVEQILLAIDERAGELDRVIQDLGLVERQVDSLLGPDSAQKVLDDLVPDASDAVAPHRRPDTDDAEWEPNRCGERMLSNVARVFGRDDLGELEGAGDLSGVLVSGLEQALAGGPDERRDGDAGRAVRIPELAEIESGVRRLLAEGQERGGVAVFDPILTSTAAGELGHTYLLEWSVNEQGEPRFLRYDDQGRDKAEFEPAGTGYDFALPDAGLGGPVFVTFLDAGARVQSVPRPPDSWRARRHSEDFRVGADEAVPGSSGNDGGPPEVHRAVRAVLARHQGLDTDLEPTGRDPVSPAWLARQRGGALAALRSWAGAHDQVGELVRHYPGIGRRLAEIGCLDAVTARKVLQDSFDELSAAGPERRGERYQLRLAEGLVGNVTGLLDMVARNHGFTAGARFLAARHRPDAFQVPGWTARGQVQISWALGEPESAETVIWYRSRVGIDAEAGEIASDIGEYLRGREPDDSVAMIVVLDYAPSEDHLALDLRYRVEAGRARADADDTAERIMRAGLVRQLTEFGEPGSGQRPRVLLVGRRAAVDAVEAAGLLPGMGDFFDGDPDIGDPLRAATWRPGGSLDMVAQASVARARTEFEQLGPAPDPDAVRKLAQRCGQRVLVQLADAEPALIAGLPGVPADIRHVANMVLLQRDSRPGREPRLLEAAAEKGTELRRLTRAAQRLPGAPEVTVLSLDRTRHGADGADIVAVGDVEKAARIRVVTRHTQADPAAFTAMAGRALGEHQKLSAGPGRTEPVATLFWVGSDLEMWRAQLAGILDGRVHAKSAGGPDIPKIEHPRIDPREFTREQLSPLPWDPGVHLVRLISVGLEQRMNAAHIAAASGHIPYGGFPHGMMRMRQEWAELYHRELRQVAERFGIAEADLDDPLLEKQWLTDISGETVLPPDLQAFRTLRNVHRASVEFDQWGTRVSQVTALGGALRQAWEHFVTGTDIRAEFDLLSGLSRRLDGSVREWAHRARRLDSGIPDPGIVAGEPIYPEAFGLRPGVRRWTSGELNTLDHQAAETKAQLSFYLDEESAAYSDAELEFQIGFRLLLRQGMADPGDAGADNQYIRIALDYLETSRLRALADQVDVKDLQLQQLGEFIDASLAAAVALAQVRHSAPVPVLGSQLRRLHLHMPDPESANQEPPERLATAARFDRFRGLEWDIQEQWVAAKQRYLDAWTELARAYPAEAERVGRLSEPAVLRDLRGPDGLDDARNQLFDRLIAAADEFGRYRDLRLRMNAWAAELEPWARTREELGDALTAQRAVVEQLSAEAGVPSPGRREPGGQTEVSGRLLAEREQQVRAVLPDVLPDVVTKERLAALAPRLKSFRAGREYLAAHRLAEAVTVLADIGDRSAAADHSLYQGLGELLEMTGDRGGSEPQPAGPTDGIAGTTPPPPPAGEVPAIGDGSAALEPPTAAFPKICAVDAQAFIDLLLNRVDPTLPSVFGTSAASRDIRDNGTDPRDIAARYRANWSPGGFADIDEMRDLAAEGAVVLGGIDTDSDAHAFVLHRWADGRVWVHVIENGVRVDAPVAEWTVPPGALYGMVLDTEEGPDGVVSYTPRHRILDGEQPAGAAGENYPRHRLGGEPTGRDHDAGSRARRRLIDEGLAAAGLELADLWISPDTTDAAEVRKQIRRTVTFLDSASTEFYDALHTEFPAASGQSDLVPVDSRDLSNRRILTRQLAELRALSLAADGRAEIDAHIAELLTVRDLVRDLADPLMRKSGFRARLLAFPQPGQPGPLVLELGVAADLAAEQVITYVPGRVADAAAARRAVRAAAALTVETNAGGRPTAVTVVLRPGAAESAVDPVVHRIATVAAARVLRSPELPQPRFEIVYRGDGREIGVEIARRFSEPAVVIRADGEPSAAPARELSTRPRPEEFRPFVRKPESVGRTGSHGGRTFELELNFLRDAALAAGTTPGAVPESENPTRTAEFVADLDKIEALTAVAKAQMEYWGGRAGQLADDAGLMRRVIELETLATRIFEAEAAARRGYDSTDRTPEVDRLRDELASRARETVEWAAERRYTWQIGDFAPIRVLGPATLRLAREFARQLAEFVTPPDLQPGGWTHRNVDALAERQRQLHRDRDLWAAHLGELIGYPPALLTPEHVEVLAERLSRPVAAGHAEADRLRHLDRELIAGAAFLAGTARAEGLALLHGATVWTRVQRAVLEQEFHKLARDAREIREMARDARELGDYDFAQEPTELNRLRELRGRLSRQAPGLEEFERSHISARLDLLIDLAETRQHLATRETALAELAGQVEDLAAQYFQARETLATGSDIGAGAAGRTTEIEAALAHALGPVLEAVRTARQPLKPSSAAHPENTVPSPSPATAAPQGSVSTGPDRAARKQARLDGDPDDLPPSAESPRGASDAEKPGEQEERPADIGDPWAADGYTPAPLNTDEQSQVAEVRRLLGGTGPVLPLRHTHVPGLALVAEAEPDLIAGRAGIPGDLRDRANRILLHRELTADPERAGGRAHELRRLDLAAAGLPGDSAVRVFSLDLHGGGTDLVVIGDIERADKIVVDVSPGVTDRSVFAAASSRALEYYNGMAADPGAGPSHAVVFWAGADIGALYEQLSAILEARAVDALDDGADGPGVPSELRFLVDRSRPLPDDFPQPALFQLLTVGLHEQLRLGFQLESYLDADPELGSLRRADRDRRHGDLLPEIARQLQVSEADLRDPVRVGQLRRDAADNPEGVSPDQLDFFALDNLRDAVAELERWRTRAEQVITLSRALATAQAHYTAGFDTHSELEMLGNLAAELDRQAGEWFTASGELHRPPDPGTVAGRPIQPEVFGLDPHARRQTSARLAALEQAIELHREKWSVYIEHAISDDELAARVAARDVRGDLDAGRPRRFRDPAVAYLQAVELHNLAVRAEAADLMFEQRTELMDASLAAVEQIIAARPEPPGLGAALRELRQHFATPGDPLPRALDDAIFERATEVLETARRNWAEAKQHSQDAWQELRGYPDNPDPGRLPDFADLRAEDALDDLDEEHEARLDEAAAAADGFAVAQLLLDRLDEKVRDLERLAAERNALAGTGRQTGRRDEIATLDREIAAGLAELIRIAEHPASSATGAPGSSATSGIAATPGVAGIASEPADSDGVHGIAGREGTGESASAPELPDPRSGQGVEQPTPDTPLRTEALIPAIGDGSAIPSSRANDVPKICAVDATAFIALLLGVDSPPIPSISATTAAGRLIREHGTSPVEFAANLGANWRLGGFADLAEMRARAAGGAVVAGAVDTDTDAHVFVLHRGIDGEVWVHTLDRGIRTDMRLAEWTPAEGRLYGVVFASEDDVDGTPTYTPEHPIAVGDYPVGVAGYDFPRHRLGGESGVSAADPADPAARLCATLGEAGSNG